MKRVWVTRPEPGASRTAQRLRDLGYAPITLPLSRVEPLTPEVPEADFDLLIATSAQAFTFLAPSFAQKFRTLPLAVVGKATAQAANEAGFHGVQFAAPDVSALLDYLIRQTFAPTRILYLCGKVRRNDLEVALTNRKTDIAVVEVYDTQSLILTSDSLKILGVTPISAVLLTSAKNAADLHKFLNHEPTAQLFDKSLFICFSQRIADQLVIAKQQSIIICNSPDEDAMMDALVQHCPL